MQIHPDLQRVEHAHRESVAGACVVAVIADGWPEDIDASVRSVVEHSAPDVAVAILDCGNVGGAGQRARALGAEFPNRVYSFHVAGTVGDIGWGPAMRTLIATVNSPFIAPLDTATILTGNAFPHLLTPFEDPTVVATGWRGANVNTEDWYSFDSAGPGEVDVALGYLMVVRTDAAKATPPHRKARFYRNADMEWCLALRDAGGRIVIPEGDLPIHQERHRGYYDSDPEYRDQESQRNYRRMLDRFKGRVDILAPR
jgi:hypothetical protein